MLKVIEKNNPIESWIKSIINKSFHENEPYCNKTKYTINMTNELEFVIRGRLYAVSEENWSLNSIA